MRRTRAKLVRSSALLATAVTAAALAAAVPASAEPRAASGQAPGAPGVTSYFDLARKDCVGTAANTRSKVWFTVAGGVLSDVYEPTIDNTNVQSLQFIVTDGRSFTDLQTRDMTYTVAADPTGMTCTVTATSAAHGYRLTTTYLADPNRDTVLMHTTLSGRRGLSVYARLDAHVNGNGGGGADNGGADSGTVDRSGVAVIGDASTVSQATNRDYAVPTYMALASRAIEKSSVGYAGSPSDGLTQLDAERTLSSRYTSAPDGHVVATSQLRGDSFDLALGFGRSSSSAVDTAWDSSRRPFFAARAEYLAGWNSYDRHLRLPRHRTGSTLLDANVLKASVDKTFPGAIVASLASPWGQAVSAGALIGGKPVYFGSYREVFGRDLYEAVTGLLADGDISTARDATRFLFQRQQLPSGEMPRNSLLNGKVAPDTGGDQLDETSYPILMAALTGLGGDRSLWQQHIKPAADFVVAHGPSYGVERWEEQSGYSPSTIAAEIAGLTAAAQIARGQHDLASAQVYQAVADSYQRQIKKWAVTSTGPYSSSPYFIRLSRNGDPNAADTYNLGNGGPTSVDQRAVVDGGFQELVRLGELSPSDPDYLNSLAVLDKQIAVGTPSGTGYYRYGTSAANGSADGYGDCYQPSQTSCTVPGQPWPTTDVGTGHLWPVLSGERAESALLTGDRALAQAQLGFMQQSASGEGLVPEQAWESPDLAASPYGTDPRTASIGFVDGKAAGSASPLTWAQAQRLRLQIDLAGGTLVDQPSFVADRYVRHGAPGSTAVSISSPTAGTTIEGSSVSVTGTAAPGASVAVAVSDTDTGAPGTSVRTSAATDGSYSVTVPIGFGTNVITSTAATASGATGVASVSVAGDLVGGTTVLDVSDPTGDDNGPGTFQYPTAADFAPGSYDITRFQVITVGATVYLRTTLANLVPTFGNTLGAQLLDVYVHAPTGTTSSAAAYPSRNYTVNPGWTQRLEVQGFASPVWVNANGDSAGSVSGVVASTLTKTVTIALPAAQFGTPGSGWSFAVALAGQDGYSPDQARAFAATPQPYNFGVCAAGNTSPICGVSPSSVPKVMDVITPAGVSQASELDPTAGPVVVHGVPVP
ncbi:MAG TPA: glucodextranase DOMON-like domain-containing protein [Jatrophihabitans sp.]|nr:glucodextranase DOMON-like domain-containing protein [Jatrophihabitans sp.]